MRVSLNAVSEYPDPAHPVSRPHCGTGSALSTTATGLLARIGDAPCGRRWAPHGHALRDGAMVARCLFDAALISETFLRGVEGIVQSRVRAAPSVG
ncbi:hypothetical protein [Streptomyces sp. KL116D]|uniref:hypothetical protein n=1 Tax=Streptomyces sp. KL116D TaxID=3045152 RepID=UPI00355699EB